jgi:hypothetical protein
MRQEGTGSIAVNRFQFPATSDDNSASRQYSLLNDLEASAQSSGFEVNSEANVTSNPCRSGPASVSHWKESRIRLSFKPFDSMRADFSSSSEVRTILACTGPPVRDCSDFDIGWACAI